MQLLSDHKRRNSSRHPPTDYIGGRGVGRGCTKKNSSTHHKKQRQRSAKLIKLLHITAYNTRIHFELHLKLHSDYVNITYQDPKRG